MPVSSSPQFRSCWAVLPRRRGSLRSHPLTNPPSDVSTSQVSPAGSASIATTRRRPITRTGTTGGDGTAVAGWYWTPHAKTELEVGITSEGDSWATLFDTARDPNGYPVPTIERRARRDLTIAATQQWQFFENAWVHPFVAAGVSIDRTRTRRERQASYRGPDDDVRPPGPLPTESQVRAHALFGTGLKAYVNERTFFRTDFHVAVGDHDVVQLRLRAGLGVDF